MKNLLLIFLASSFWLTLEAKRIPGQILYSNDTVDVVFDIPRDLDLKKVDYVKLQHKVEYFDPSGKKRIVLKPRDAKEFRFMYEDIEIRMLSRCNCSELGNAGKNNNIFIKLESEGKLKLFKWYSHKRSTMMTNPSTGAMTTWPSPYFDEEFVFQKDDGVLKWPKSLTFRKDMMEYFSDCPKVQHLIDIKEYKKDDLEAIVRCYNSNCWN